MTLNHRQLQQNIFLILTSVLCDERRIKSDGDGGAHFIYPTKIIKFEPQYATKLLLGIKLNIWRGAGREGCVEIMFYSRQLVINQFLHSRMFPLVASLKCIQHPLVAKFPSQGTIPCQDHWIQLNVSIRLWEFQSHEGKGAKTGQGVWFRLSLFLKTLYASTPNSCLYLPLYHSINCYCLCIVLEV